MRFSLHVLALALLPVSAHASDTEQLLPEKDELTAADPLTHVDHFLPPEIAGDIESGRIWTGHLAPPGTFDARFVGPVRDEGDGTCRRATYWFLLEEIPGQGTRIAKRRPAKDLVAPRAATSGGQCIAETGMVPRNDRYPDRQLYGLRTLAEIVDSAKSGAVARDQVECRTDDGACEDAMATLAAFDLQDLISLQVRSLVKDCGPIEGRTRLCTMRPIGDGDPFMLEARFPDRNTGQTWKLEWEARDGEPLALSMLRTMIV